MKDSEETYKIIGNIMVKTPKDSLQKDLAEKKEMFELRVKTLEKQEKKLKEKAKEIQADVLDGMKNE
jgi:prefoldin beta subunit